MKSNFSYKLERLRNPTAAGTKDINILLPQQAERPHLLTLRELRRVVGQSCIEMYVARVKIGMEARGVVKRGLYYPPRIAGMASVIFYRVPTGLIAFIEEFTVDEAFRGRGIGVALIQKLIARAKAKKAKHISTYTNPKRFAANAVYQKLGFFKKETNFYRINLVLPKPSSKKEILKIKNFQLRRNKHVA